MRRNVQEEAGPSDHSFVGDDDDSASNESSSSSSSSAGSVIIKTRDVSWTIDETIYTANIQVTRNGDFDMIQNVRASLFVPIGDRQGDPIGTVLGTILPRNGGGRGGDAPSFYEWADSVSSELLRLCTLFCDPTGAAVRIPSLRKEGHDHHHVCNGGFFHVNAITVDVSYKGRDVGLRFLHEVMLYLRNDWTILVMEVSPMTHDLRERLQIKQHNPDKRRNTIQHACNYTDAEQVLVDRAEVKLARHLSRMHLRQAGRCPEEYLAWYVTSTTYFHAAAVDAEYRWKTKEESDQLNVYVPGKPRKSMGVDLTLRHLLEERKYGVTACRDLVTQIENLVVDQGGSLHNARALFALFSDDGNDDDSDSSNGNNNSNNAVLFQTLLRLGGNVDAADEYGNRPLHIVAELMRPLDIALLLSSSHDAGPADRNVTNDRGDTPLQSLQRARRRMADVAATVGIEQILSPLRAQECLDSCLWLLPAHETRFLIDGWMSPRMRFQLADTATLVRMQIQRCARSFSSSSSSSAAAAASDPLPPRPLRECATPDHNRHSWQAVPLIQYIPTEILTTHCPDGLDKSYVEGWGIVWETIERILGSHPPSSMTITTTIATPTVATIQQEIQQMMAMDNTTGRLQQQKFDHFVAKGGQIEFALDALLNVTCNLAIDRNNLVGDDDDEEKMATPPAIPCLDTAFDIARLKCFAIDLTSQEANDDSALFPKGPYRHNFAVHSARRRTVTMSGRHRQS
jgi:hypothetical protein